MTDAEGPRRQVRWHGLWVRSFWTWQRGWAASYRRGSHRSLVDGCESRDQAVRLLREWVAEA